MLTEKQAGLFKLLNYDNSREQAIRNRHQIAIKLGAPKSFTKWLENCLHYQWRQANKSIYVGD
jgi:hypothetical protein